MGGLGSGRPSSGKATTQALKRIEICYLKRNGILSQIRSGQLTWSCNGEPSGFIHYTSTGNALHLEYRYRQGDGDWQPIRQTIHFTLTPCHFGGHRIWFICPHCSRRCGTLYAGGPRFLCRSCYRIPYHSQTIDRTGRMIHKLHKIADRIFDETGYRKAKGMHWKTFERLLDHYHELDERIDLRMLNPSIK